ncbi:hypothetical protein F7725_021363 [Dissostichus mawsoni]|uniref:Uncharacterized protein n=1 Tax=Dissostichus mawsoni TaxID=36200 RepID=A0A7J5ZAZ2_DISMA|nr:hypothetical protein F7725_021363 [Dissostichus mawsoni]
MLYTPTTGLQSQLYRKPGVIPLPSAQSWSKFLQWIPSPSAQSWSKYLEWILPSAQSWPKYLEWIPPPSAQSWSKFLQWIPLPSAQSWPNTWKLVQIPAVDPTALSELAQILGVDSTALCSELAQIPGVDSTALCSELVQIPAVDSIALCSDPVQIPGVDSTALNHQNLIITHFLPPPLRSSPPSHVPPPLSTWTTSYLFSLNITFRNLHSIDHNHLSELLSSNLPLDATLSSPDDLLNHLNSTLLTSLNTLAPLKNKTVTFKTSSPWFTPALRKMKQRGRQFERLSKKSSLTVHYISYKLHLNAYKDALIAAKSAYLSNIFTDPSHNPRTLFSTVNKLFKPLADNLPTSTSATCSSFLQANSEWEDMRRQMEAEMREREDKNFWKRDRKQLLAENKSLQRDLSTTEADDRELKADLQNSSVISS